MTKPRGTLDSSGRINDTDADDGVKYIKVDNVSVIPKQFSDAIVIFASHGAVLLRDFHPDWIWLSK